MTDSLCAKPKLLKPLNILNIIQALFFFFLKIYVDFYLVTIILGFVVLEKATRSYN